MRKLELIFIVATVTCVALIGASTSLADSYSLTLTPPASLTVGQPYVIQASGTDIQDYGDGFPTAVYLDVDTYSPAFVSTCPLNVEAADGLAYATGGSVLATSVLEQVDEEGNWSNPVGDIPTAAGPLLVCGYTSQTGVTLATATLSLTVAPAPTPTPTPTPSPTPTPTPTPTPPALKPVPAVHVGTVSGAKGRLTVKLSCPAGGKACARATVRATVIEHLTGTKLMAVTARTPDKRVRTTTRKVVIVSGSASLKAGATRKVTLKLDATGRKLLARYRKLTAIVTITSGGKIRKTVTIHMQEPKQAAHTK